MNTLLKDLASLAPHHAILQTAYQHALQRVAQLGFPPKSAESWRFGSPAQTDPSGFNLAPAGVAPTATQQITDPPCLQDALRIVLENGHLVHVPAHLPAGLHVLTLAAFADQFPESARRHLLDSPATDLGSPRLAALNACLQHQGVALVATQPVDTPVAITHLISGNKCLACPFTLIVTQPGAQLHVLERHIGISEHPAYCVGRHSLHAAANSTLAYALLQQLNTQSRAVELMDMTVDDSAALDHFCAHTGAAWARQETVYRALGDHASIRLFSANHVQDNRQLDQRTLQHHVYRGASGNLLYSNVLSDTAQTTFGGMILVDPGAHDTNAYQKNHNLMLSDSATAHSLPRLEILADRVQCSHGAATAPISQEEVFYLLSRGIPAPMARTMIAQGFLRHTVEQFGSALLRPALENLLLN